MAQQRAKHRGQRKRPIHMHGAALVAAPVAATVTISAIGFGLQTSPSEAGQVVVSQTAGLDRLSERAVGTSRSGSRGEVQARAERDEVQVRTAERREARREAARLAEQQAAQEAARATRAAIRDADTRLWTTTELDIWTASGESAEQEGVLDVEKKVLVTGRSEEGRDEVVLDGASRWVTAGYLAEEKPVEEEPAEEELGLGGECTNGSTIATPVSQNIVDVHRVTCANFPDITSYGTLRSDGEHSQGLAIDIMVSGERGWEVAEYLRANYAELGINYLIYSQQIWSVDRSGEGWRAMEDRGSTTANHYDHVHVTTY